MSASAADERVNTVTRFLDRMAHGDWDAMAACVAPDVVRIGPYRDVVRGRDAYRTFLAEVISALEGYRMDVSRIWSDGDCAAAELAEEMDIDGQRRRTDEAVTFDFDDDGLISRVAVYLQPSYLLT